jgi:hypothetical protein
MGQTRRLSIPVTQILGGGLREMIGPAGGIHRSKAKKILVNSPPDH